LIRHFDFIVVAAAVVGDNDDDDVKVLNIILSRVSCIILDTTTEHQMYKYL